MLWWSILSEVVYLKIIYKYLFCDDSLTRLRCFFFWNDPDFSALWFEWAGGSLCSLLCHANEIKFNYTTNGIKFPQQHHILSMHCHLLYPYDHMIYLLCTCMAAFHSSVLHYKRYCPPWSFYCTAHILKEYLHKRKAKYSQQPLQKEFSLCLLWKNVAHIHKSTGHTWTWQAKGNLKQGHICTAKDSLVYTTHTIILVLAMMEKKRKKGNKQS